MKQLTTFDDYLGAVIKDEINRRGLKRKDIAESLHVSYHQFDNMLNGRSRWTVENYHAVCEILNEHMDILCDKAIERGTFSWEALLHSL